MLTGGEGFLDMSFISLDVALNCMFLKKVNWLKLFSLIVGFTFSHMKC